MSPHISRSSRRCSAGPAGSAIASAVGRPAAVPGFEEIRAAATAPLVYVAAARDGGYALIVSAGRIEPIVVPLPRLTEELVEADALRYLDGSYYFDLHPPLGKLLLAGWAKLAGVTATAQSTDPVVVLRVLPALAGTALVAVFYQLLRELTASRKVATFGAALLLLDNAILVESRLILVDSMLLLFGIGALTCYLASQRHTGRAHWMLLISSAILAGMAVSEHPAAVAGWGVGSGDAVVRRGREQPVHGGLRLHSGGLRPDLAIGRGWQ